MRATDTFAAFVETVAEALDDHDADGAELAGRIGMSRFHLARVVASTAGEPPAAFRRRILLERAAYRLATTGRTVLDVGVEAGYSSNEAFTRAFSRAFGSPPRRWRRSPGRIQLPAPNAVHFHPPDSMLLPARREVTAMDVLVRMLEHDVWLTGEMVRAAGRLPAGRLDDPITVRVDGADAGLDTDPTIRTLLSRLVGQLGMWSAAIAGRSYDFGIERDEPLGAIGDRLATTGTDFLAQVRQICAEGRLEESIVCPGERIEVYTYGGMVAHVLTYSAYRRTLVAGALVASGVAIPDDDPIRWVGERAGADGTGA